MIEIYDSNFNNILFIYSIYLFIFINHGKISIIFKIKNGILVEYFVLLIHWIPLNLIFLKLYFI